MQRRALSGSVPIVDSILESSDHYYNYDSGFVVIHTFVDSVVTHAVNTKCLNLTITQEYNRSM